jgi:hypothetical protein
MIFSERVVTKLWGGGGLVMEARWLLIVALVAAAGQAFASTPTFVAATNSNSGSSIGTNTQVVSYGSPTIGNLLLVQVVVSGGTNVTITPPSPHYSQSSV